jgi:hypothetical protein
MKNFWVRSSLWFVSRTRAHGGTGVTEKTIHDEEKSGVDITESMADLKVRFHLFY